MHFENPKSVSNGDIDVLVVELEDFRDPQGELIYDSLIIRRNMPSQTSIEAAEAVESAGAAASSVVGASTTINIVLNLVMSSSLNQMLSHIKNTQLMVHLTLLRVDRPPITANFF